MKNFKIVIALSFFLSAVGGCIQVAQHDGVPLAPKENRRSNDFHPFTFEYSLENLKDNFSEDMMRLAASQYEKVQEVNSEGKWKPTIESINEHRTPDWFEDAKFGMFVDWGPWSVGGWAPKKDEGGVYPDWYEERMYSDSLCRIYHERNWGKDFKRDDFLPLFTAGKYDPEDLTDIALEAGMKYIIPFCKHHGGFCLWPSSFTMRDAGDMGPRRDLIKPLVRSCAEEGLKFGFYFSIEEWEYPLIDNEGNLVIRNWGGKTESYSKEIEKKVSGKIAVKDFAVDYLIPQATEFIDRYNPDILWYDGDWTTSVNDLKSCEIAAYFYNKAEGSKDVAVNDRLGLQINGQFSGGNYRDKWLRFKSGDFFTSEYHDYTDQNKIHPWEECRGISQSFGYNWQDTDENVISTKEFINMFVDIVAQGGNLLLVVNLDGHGALPEIQKDRLKDIGEWLKINGEGIYATRRYPVQSDEMVAYTRSKDGKYVYAILKKWTGQELCLKGIAAKEGSKIEMLGYPEALKWSNTDKGLNIRIPDEFQNEKSRPCKYAWVLKIQAKNDL